MTGSPTGYRHVSDRPHHWYRCDNLTCGQERPFVTYRERGHKCRECEGHMTFFVQQAS